MDISQLISLIPSECGPYVAVFIVVCKIITVFWPAPVAGSKLAVLYKIINAFALNFGKAANMLQSAKVGVPVPRPDAHAAKQAVAEKGIAVK